MVYQSKREKSSLRSTVKHNLLTEALRKGSWAAGIGALLIILGGTFLPSHLLAYFGIPIFFLGLSLIALGLRPYRQLTRLQIHPQEIFLQDDSLIFFVHKQPLFALPTAAIQEIKYIEAKKIYGLGVILKKPLEAKIRLLQPKAKFAAFVSKYLPLAEGYDLFLPYFSESAFDTVKDWLELDRAS